MRATPWLCSTLALLGAISFATPGAALEIGPADDLCAAIERLGPGEELALRGGDYQGPCVIARGGSAEAPLVIRAADPADPPRIVYTGTRTDVIRIRADHVTLRGLRFGPTHGYVDAIRLWSKRGVTIEECEFTAIDGLAVVANKSSLTGLIVRRNVVRDSRATAFYIGCHDGVGCEVSDFLIEGNLIQRAGFRPDGVGYGVQVKLNSTGVIRDNAIVETKGPGIMVYGSRDPERTTLIERNFVSSSRQSSGIVVGGGPALIRNNVSVSSADAGIALQDYNARGLLRGIAVVHNTLFDNAQAGVWVAPSAQDVVVSHNAAHARAAALPDRRPGLSLSGNVDCSGSTAACFEDAPARAFAPGPLLAGRGAARAGWWAPADDYFGVRRGTPPSVGAVERGGRAIRLGPAPRPVGAPAASAGPASGPR